MTTLTRKGYGRIYVQDEADVPLIHAIVKEMDEYEYNYMPKDLVAPFIQYPNVVYVGKFDDLDLDSLAAICFARGCPIFVFDSGRQEYPKDAVAAHSASLEAK